MNGTVAFNEVVNKTYYNYNSNPYNNNNPNLTATRPVITLASQSAVNKTLTVLIVDDSVAVRETLITILEMEDDIKVVGEAYNGRMAVQMAREIKPDVIIMDVKMPGCGDFDGIAACAQVKAEQAAKTVILTTAHADSTAAERAAAAGCDLFLEKNFSVYELLSRVRRSTI